MANSGISKPVRRVGVDAITPGHQHSREILKTIFPENSPPYFSRSRHNLAVLARRPETVPFRGWLGI